MLKEKTILIIGGAGAVGSQLTNTLTKICKKVIVLDNLTSGYTDLLQKSPNLLFIEGDIRSDSDLKRCFNESPDIVFHLAAFFANQNSVDYPQEDISVNGSGTLKLYEYCALYGKLEKIIYASSGCSIYGSAPMPYVEDVIEPMHLSTPYQITKMLGELYGNYFIRQYNLPICYARFFNSYGQGEYPGQYRNVIPNFIYWALQGQSLPITGTGDETRDFTSVKDIVQGLILMAENDQAIGEAFNLAAGREIQIRYLAELINKETSNEAPINFKPRRSWDSKPRLLASNDKAKKILGFNPSLDFESNIIETVAWFRQNWDKVLENADFGPGMSSAVRD
jgi:nucleoside-diphosphate-sugar epimerase